MVSNVTFVNIEKWKLFIKQKIFLQKFNHRNELNNFSWSYFSREVRGLKSFRF